MTSIRQHIPRTDVFKMWHETVFRSAYERKRFQATTIPYTPLSLIHEIFQQIDIIKNQQHNATIAVLHTVEMAVYLLWLGFTHITLTREYDQVLANKAKIFGYKYMLEERSEKRSLIWLLVIHITRKLLTAQRT